MNKLAEIAVLQFVPSLKGSDTTTTVIGVAVFALFMLFLITAGARGSGSTKKSRGIGKRAFKKAAHSRGLNRQQVQLLLDLAKQSGSKPESLLQNSAVLDSSLKKAFSALEHDPNLKVDKEVRKLELYRIKQRLERSGGGPGNYGSTSQLKLGQALTVQDEGGERYRSKLNGNLQKNISLTVPLDRRGGQIRWKKWTKLKIFFWRPNGQGYSFETKVLGYNQLKGVSSLFVQHSSKIRKEQQRKFRRRDMNRPAYFYPIRVVSSGTGKHSQKKAVVEHRRSTLGTLLDISAGGCALRSNYPLAGGELVKLEFDSGNGQVTVFGKVRSINKVRPIGGIMHIQFTRLSRKNLNKINSYIYGFEGSPTKK